MFLHSPYSASPGTVFSRCCRTSSTLTPQLTKSSSLRLSCALKPFRFINSVATSGIVGNFLTIYVGPGFDFSYCDAFDVDLVDDDV